VSFLDDDRLKALPPEETLPIVFPVVILGEALLDVLDQLGQRGPALAVVVDIPCRDEPILAVELPLDFQELISAQILIC